MFVVWYISWLRSWN